MRPIYLAVSATVLLGLIVAFAMVTKAPSLGSERLLVADARQAMSALLYVAQAKGYFRDEGLDVEMKPYSLGREALAGTLDGQADFAAVGEAPIIHAVMADRDVSVFATIQTTDSDMAVVARGDHGISSPKDLAGRRVGYIAGTGSELFLNLYLASNDLSGKVQMVPTPVDDAIPALTEGRIDGLSAWTSLRFPAERALEGRATVLTETGIYTKNWVLAARPETLGDRRPAFEGLLRALIRAETHVQQNPKEAASIVADTLGIAREEMEEVWPFFGFSVDLSQSLLVAFEQAARMDNKRRPGQPEPNFLENINPEPLRAVDAERVTMLR